MRSHTQTHIQITFKMIYIEVKLQVLFPIYFSVFSKICLVSMDYLNN